jgi:hypothetical protein
MLVFGWRRCRAIQRNHIRTALEQEFVSEALILDSDVVIAGERRGHAVPQIPAQL